MRREEVNEIIACLPTGKTRFFYFPRRYALMMLGVVVGEHGEPIDRLRASRFRRLLDHEVVRGVLAGCGDGRLTRDALEAAWPSDPECYLLTLGHWACQSRELKPLRQMSRLGSNLVLQLNFSSKHNRPYHRMVSPEGRHPFEYYGHPIAQHDGYHTLAWARLDIDLGRGEALIEEIQNDWVRFADVARRSLDLPATGEVAARQRQIVQWMFGNDPLDPEEFRAYVREHLEPHARMWDEATLAAAIWFLCEELGVRRIFHHTFESGNRLKGIAEIPGLAGNLPPRSMYGKLPRRFCFQETGERPSFLRGRRIRAMHEEQPLRFQLLEL